MRPGVLLRLLKEADAVGGGRWQRGQEEQRASRERLEDPREAALPIPRGPCLLGVVLALWTLPTALVGHQAGRREKAFRQE